jgi:hypothetical protein
MTCIVHIKTTMILWKHSRYYHYKIHLINIDKIGKKVYEKCKPEPAVYKINTQKTVEMIGKME